MKHPTTFHRSPRGLAALEFVMVLPILVALLILIFYVGHAGSDQMELAKNLHYQTWRTRYDDQPGDVTPLSFVKIEQGEINGKDSGKVESKLIYDKWKHGTKTRARFDANTWSRDSKWDDEAKYAVRAKDIKREPGETDDQYKERRNQRVFYNQKNSLTYVSNLPYYPTGLGDGTDDDPEDDEGEEEKEEPKKPEEEESTKGYFIKRPLAADYEDYLMETWSCEEGGCWSDVHNLEAVHEHYIDPTSGYQVGYGPQGIFNQDDTAVEYRKRVATEEFDTKIIRQAVENLRATGNWEPKGTEKRSDGTRRGYDLFYHNCQDFADALRAEYYRIKNMKGGELAVGDETYLFPILFPIFNAL